MIRRSVLSSFHPRQRRLLVHVLNCHLLQFQVFELLHFFWTSGSQVTGSLSAIHVLQSVDSRSSLTPICHLTFPLQKDLEGTEELLKKHMIIQNLALREPLSVDQEILN